MNNKSQFDNFPDFIAINVLKLAMNVSKNYMDSHEIRSEHIITEGMYKEDLFCRHNAITSDDGK